MDFNLSRPLLNAAGSLGFAPDPRSGVDFSRFGAFITNPISAGLRSPAQGLRFYPTPGGLLLHTGHPNPGFNATLRRYGQIWERASLPVIVHLLGQHPDDLASMVRRLEGVDNVVGIELGLPPGIDAVRMRMLVEAALGELLLIARLPESAPGGPGERSLAELALQAGAGAVSLGPRRGLFYRHGRAEAPGDTPSQLFGGRLYGPAVLPEALGRVRDLSDLGIPVIGAGGVYSEADLQAMLAAGASAVQVDTALWRRMPWLFLAV